MDLGLKKDPPETLHLAGYDAIVLAAGMACCWDLTVLGTSWVDKGSSARVFPSPYSV